MADTRFDPSAPQSVEYYAGQGPVHRSTTPPSPSQLLMTYGPQTLWEAVRPTLEEKGKSSAFGVRPLLPSGKHGDFVFNTYGDVAQIVKDFGAGLRFLGLNPKDRLGCYAKNRPEWAYTFLASLANNFVVVPLYDTLGPDASVYVINHAELGLIISSGENALKLLAAKAECAPMKTIITMDPLSPEALQQAKKVGVEVHNFQDVVDMGKKNPRSLPTISPDDLFVIMYTSGTTGVPKGVMLNNANGVSAVATARLRFDMHEGDSYLSYLPMAHIMELIIFTISVSMGGAVGFWRGDALLLVDDLAALKPTLLFGVPRVFNRIYDKINQQINEASVVKRSLFNYAFATKLTQLHETGEVTHSLWDRLVFSKVAAVIGGRVRLVLSGSAPLSPVVQDFLRVVLCTNVIQAYGLTETAAMLTAQDTRDPSSGHVGAPQPCVEVKLVDVPEMNYLSSGPQQQGEICVRGGPIFKGYYKMPEKTAEDVDRDGWFHTGDIGQWLPNGVLKIIDRKKNIFKLAQGEYVAAEYLETVYLKSKYIMQIFVYGDSFKNFLVAICVPDPEVLLPWARKQGFPENMVELCKDERVKKIIFASLMKVGNEANLKGFEKVKNIHLEPTPWTPDTLLTPTLKLKRNDAKKAYQTTIDILYSDPKVVAQSKL